MTKKDDGGPAFPLTNREYQEAYGGAPGMTLRDHFAGQAYPAIFGAHRVQDDFLREPGGSYAEFVANLAYKAADAMLAERAK